MYSRVESVEEREEILRRRRERYRIRMERETDEREARFVKRKFRMRGTFGGDLKLAVWRR